MYADVRCRYRSGLQFNGLFYMQPISGSHTESASQKNFSLFRKLCGDEALGNAVVVTTGWDGVTLAKGAAREYTLQTDDALFAPALQKGARTFRHDNTLSTAQAILGHVIGNQPRALRIQREIVDDRKDIALTAAGIELDTLRRVRKVEEVLEKERAAREDREKEVARLAAELGAGRSREASLMEEVQRQLEETKLEFGQARAQLVRNIEDLESDRDRLTKQYAVERQKAQQNVRRTQGDLDVERTAREQKEKEVARLAAQMKDLRVRSTQEKEEALALKDEESRKALEQLREELLRDVEKIGSDLDRLSKQYAEEKAAADELLRKTQQDLSTERAARKEKERDVVRLTSEMESTRSLLTREKEEALALKDEETRKALEQLRGELSQEVEKIASDLDHLSKQYAEEKAVADKLLRKTQQDLETESAARKEKEKGVVRLTSEMESTRSLLTREREEALALKDEETRMALEQLRGELLQDVEKIGSDLDRLSAQYAEEKAAADELVRRTQEDVETERAARMEKEKDVARLTAEMEGSRAQSAREREEVLALTDEVKRELERVRGELEQSLSDRDRLSREYAEEKTKAEEYTRKIQEDLVVERSEHEGRLRQVAKLEGEKEEMTRQLEHIKGQQKRGSIFSMFGR